MQYTHSATFVRLYTWLATGFKCFGSAYEISWFLIGDIIILFDIGIMHGQINCKPIESEKKKQPLI